MTEKEKQDLLVTLRYMCAHFDPNDSSYVSSSEWPYPYIGGYPDQLLMELREVLLDIAPDHPRTAELVACIDYCVENVYSPFNDSDLNSICSACQYYNRCVENDGVVIHEDVYSFLCDIGVYDNL